MPLVHEDNIIGILEDRMTFRSEGTAVFGASADFFELILEALQLFDWMQRMSIIIIMTIFIFGIYPSALQTIAAAAVSGIHKDT